jgi:hydroxymethylglutaryl-CoA lyase
MGVYELSLGDTIGIGHPGQVQTILNALYQDGVKPESLALHMHDTRGVALANVLSGLQAGVRTFDSAFGGLGGCPYAPGAAGNLATEDLVHMLEAMGHDTGVNLGRLVDVSAHMQDLIGRTLPSKVLQAELAVRAKAERRQSHSRTG